MSRLEYQTTSKYKDMSTSIVVASNILDIQNKRVALITASSEQDFHTIYSNLSDGETFTGIAWGSSGVIIRATGNIYLGTKSDGTNPIVTITLQNKDTITLMRLQIVGISSAKWIVIAHTGFEA